MTDLKISVEPLGTDRYAILIAGTNRGAGTRLAGPNALGYTETDLRSEAGLPKCGLTEVQVDRVIALANRNRTDSR